MSRLSLLGLFLLLVDNTSGTSPPPLTSSSTAVSQATPSVSSQTSPNPRATPDRHVTPSVKMRSNSTTNLNSKTTSKPAPLEIAGTSKIATPMNTTTMTSGGTTLNPTGSTHFLCYVIFLLFCVQSAWRGLELYIPISVLYHLLNDNKHTREIKFISTHFLGSYHYPSLIWLFAKFSCVSLIITSIQFPSLQML